ncbi:hypothetical protein C8R41DRAFT_865945 [Lentinula lateritia]|uniref:RxLR effector protein n=1 Tax=Lentinula lateritia TaxID=40482 RepID=A0ABQ8VK86_9AGAR|nr:hypothetical protein C8R41DRAFT_865945 [Lentinula lateritia]
MPSFRSLFLHLLALCIISSTVPNVVATPIALQGGLLEARASNLGVLRLSTQRLVPQLSRRKRMTQTPKYSETGSSSDNESSHDPEDDTEEPDPEFKNVPIRLWRTKNADFHQRTLVALRRQAVLPGGT